MIWEGFLEEGVPKPVPGEGQAVDRCMGEKRAFGLGNKVQRAWWWGGTHTLTWVQCWGVAGHSVRAAKHTFGGNKRALEAGPTVFWEQVEFAERAWIKEGLFVLYPQG